MNAMNTLGAYKMFYGGEGEPPLLTEKKFKEAVEKFRLEQHPMLLQPEDEGYWE